MQCFSVRCNFRWKKLEDEGEIPVASKRHKFLDNDEWLNECLGAPDAPEAEEWNIKTLTLTLTLTPIRGMEHKDTLEDHSHRH